MLSAVSRLAAFPKSASAAAARRAFILAPSATLRTHHHHQQQADGIKKPFDPAMVEEHNIENDVYASAKDQIVAQTDDVDIASAGTHMHVLSEPEAAVYSLAKDEITPFTDDVVQVKSALFRVAEDEPFKIDERFIPKPAVGFPYTPDTSGPSKDKAVRRDDAVALSAASKIKTSMLHPERPSTDKIYDTYRRMKKLSELSELEREEYKAAGINPDSVDPAAEFGKDRPFHEHADYPYVQQDIAEPKDDYYSATKGTYEATEKYASTAFDTDAECVGQVSKLNQARHQQQLKQDV